MDATAKSYVISFLIPLPLATWMTRDLFANGCNFLIEGCQKNKALANRVNRLRIIGFSPIVMKSVPDGSPATIAQFPHQPSLKADHEVTILAENNHGGRKPRHGKQFICIQQTANPLSRWLIRSNPSQV